MIDFGIVDTHLHLWDTNKLCYPWLDDIPLLNKTFLPKDYNMACGNVKVDKMVFVQCECDTSQCLDEVSWVSELSDEDRRIQGIVARAALEKGEGARQELEELSKNRMVKGIRRIIQFERDLEFCLMPDFIKGVRILSEFELSFDICISHIQMANTIRLVEQCPDVQFILDHIGKPDIKNKVLQPWMREIKTLSGFQNVYCKVSGLATEADHKNWTREDLKPYLERVFECFGFDRTIYGGDWPVASQAIDYPEWVKTLKEFVKGCSNGELRKLFRENAINFYRLPKTAIP